MGSHIGETEKKTREILDKAEGGVLFVDEAYQLASDTPRDFGVLALGVLMGAMDNRNVAIVMAGYEQDMQKLFEANAGLARRVDPDLTINFPDYSTDELDQIMDKMLTAKGRIMSVADRRRATEEFVAAAKNSSNFGNAGEVSRRVRSAIIKASRRLSKARSQGKQLSRDELRTLVFDDFKTRG